MTTIVTRAGKGSELTWAEVDANFTGLQTTADAAQPGDADLTALAAIASTGIPARTAANTWTVRTLTGTTNQVTVTNGDGVSGNPTFSLPQDIHTGATPTFSTLTLSASTNSTSKDTGTLVIQNGGLGVELDTYIGGTITARGATHQFGDSALAAPIEYQILSASGYRRAIRYMTGANGRWLLAANTESESGSDAGCSFSITAYNDAGSSIDTPISLTRASGGQITFGSTSRPASVGKTANGAEWIFGSSSELLTLSTAGLTTNTSASLLPANAIIEAVVCRVTTAITATTNWAVGDSTISSRFSSANATLAAGTTSVGLNHVDQTGASGPKQTSAATVRITCTGSNPGAGAIRITVFWRKFVAPTS